MSLLYDFKIRDDEIPAIAETFDAFCFVTARIVKAVIPSIVTIHFAHRCAGLPFVSAFVCHERFAT